MALENDVKYQAPQVTDPSLQVYVEDWRRQGVYPPKLTVEERAIVDRDGKLDAKGNRHGVVWELGGRPLATKTTPDGHIYTKARGAAHYSAYYGCFDARYID